MATSGEYEPPPEGDMWESLERKWNKVVGNEETVGVRSGHWHVRKEYSGDGLGPIAGEFDEVAVYFCEWGSYGQEEIGRWKLSEVAEYDG